MTHRDEMPDQPPPCLPPEFHEDWSTLTEWLQKLPWNRPSLSDTRIARWRAALERLAAGQRFKDFVHAYLTHNGVPEGDPTNQHQLEGCRIGARLDLLLAERDDWRNNYECAATERKRVIKGRAALQQEVAQLRERVGQLEALIQECQEKWSCGCFGDQEPCDLCRRATAAREGMK